VKRFALLLICFCCVLSGFSQDTSRVEFIIRNIGIGVDGHFNSVQIETKLNAEGDLQSIQGAIEVASIETGIDSRDEHLLKADYFDVLNHATITLVSNAVIETSEGVFKVDGVLTIKGKSKDISITVQRKKENNQYTITSSFQINRRDYHVGGRSIAMSNTVKINVVHYHSL